MAKAPSNLKDITSPTLLLRPDIAKANLRRMLAKTKAHNLEFRPHFKTHQSHEIGRWVRKAKIDRIACSSLRMAEYFAEDGWTDITLAIPLNLREADRLKALAQKIRLNLILDHPSVAARLAGMNDTWFQVWLEIDTGDRRTGIPPEDTESILACAQTIHAADKLHFSGLIGHGGHSYEQANPYNATAFYKDQVKQLQQVAEMLKDAGIQVPGISFGDTPLFSMSDTLEGITEARPGNFLFYDLMQVGIGSCKIDDIAVAMACPVISKSPSRSEIIVHGGGVHFSKDFLSHPGSSGRSYGQAVQPTEKGWEAVEGVYLSGLSQEHGVVQVDAPGKMEEWDHGDLMIFLPVHSCHTADAMGGYRVYEKGKLGDYIRMMPKQ